MEEPKVYIFRQSALLPPDDALKGEIGEIDFNVSNLILKMQGHYLALSALRETLSDLLDSCDLNLQCIRIIPDESGDEAASRAIGLTDLSKQEKCLVISTGIISTVAIKVLAGIFDCSFEEVASHVAAIGQAEFGKMSLDDIEKSVERMAEVLRENPGGGAFMVEI